MRNLERTGLLTNALGREHVTKRLSTIKLQSEGRLNAMASLSVGDDVELHGLVGAASLNGSRGVVVASTESLRARGRLPVLLATGKQARSSQYNPLQEPVLYCKGLL